MKHTSSISRCSFRISDSVKISPSSFDSFKSFGLLLFVSSFVFSDIFQCWQTFSLKTKTKTRNNLLNSICVRLKTIFYGNLMSGDTKNFGYCDFVKKSIYMNMNVCIEWLLRIGNDLFYAFERHLVSRHATFDCHF